MTTYNTGNPIGSTDPKDLFDNAQNLDFLANGTAANYNDRFGNSRRSLAGINAAADQLFTELGYSPPVTYTAGISLTLPTQTVEYNGLVYSAKSAELPFTTSGTFETGKFRIVTGNLNTVSSQLFSGDGVTVSFLLSNAPVSKDNTQVYIGGLYQNKDTYSLVSTTITFSEAPVEGTDNIEVITISTLPIGETAANLVTYTPAGTGAVATNVQAKLREFVSVKDFGAVGDGVADDRASLQAAINSGAKKLYWPAGTYMVSSRLIPVSGQEWVGGIGATTIKLTAGAASNADLIARNANGLEGSLDDFSMTGFVLDASVKDTAFLVYGCSRLRFTDVVFRNGGTYGFGAQARPGFTVALAQDDIWFERCGFENNGQDGSFDGLDIKYCTNTHLVSCWSTGNTDAGFNLRGSGISLVSCNSLADGVGIRIQATDLAGSNATRAKLSGCTVRNAVGVGIQIQASTLNETFIDASSCLASSNGTTGFEFSGAGLIRGTISGFTSVLNAGPGVNIMGNTIGGVVFSGGVVQSNGTDGISTSGQNAIFDAVRIIGNTGTGYRESGSANNNYLATSCVISGNGTDIGTRVGTESDDGFLSVRAANNIRVFPGTSAGLELQAAAGFANVVAVGDAASIDLRLITKGNGNVSLFKDNGSRQIADFREAGSATVNYPDFIASLTNTPVQINASGGDTNIDLQLTPKGTGRVRFGTLTANADAPITGYIEVKDAGGTVRKLAVIT
jgi:hypothetical protein